MFRRFYVSVTSIIVIAILGCANHSITSRVERALLKLPSSYIWFEHSFFSNRSYAQLRIDGVEDNNRDSSRSAPNPRSLSRIPNVDSSVTPAEDWNQRWYDKAIYGTFGAGGVYDSFAKKINPETGELAPQEHHRVYNIGEDSNGRHIVFCNDAATGQLRWWHGFADSALDLKREYGTGHLSSHIDVDDPVQYPSLSQSQDMASVALSSIPINLHIEPTAPRLDPVWVWSVNSNGHLVVVEDRGPQPQDDISAPNKGQSWDLDVDGANHNPNPYDGDNLHNRWENDNNNSGIEEPRHIYDTFPHPESPTDSTNIINFNLLGSDHVYGSPNIDSGVEAIDGQPIQRAYYAGFRNGRSGFLYGVGARIIANIPINGGFTSELALLPAPYSWAFPLTNVSPRIMDGNSASTPAIQNIGLTPVVYLIVSDYNYSEQDPTSRPSAVLAAYDGRTSTTGNRLLGISTRLGAPHEFSWYRNDEDRRPKLVSPVLKDQRAYISTPDAIFVYDVSAPGAMPLVTTIPATAGSDGLTGWHIASMPVVVGGDDPQTYLCFIEQRAVRTVDYWRVRVVRYVEGSVCPDRWVSNPVIGRCNSQPQVDHPSVHDLYVYVADNERVFGFSCGESFDGYPPGRDPGGPPLLDYVYVSHVFTTTGNSYSSAVLPAETGEADGQQNFDSLRRLYVGGDNGSLNCYKVVSQQEPDDYKPLLRRISGTVTRDIDADGTGDVPETNFELELVIDGSPFARTSTQASFPNAGAYSFDGLSEALVGTIRRSTRLAVNPDDFFVPLLHTVGPLDTPELFNQNFVYASPNPFRALWSSWGNHNIKETLLGRDARNNRFSLQRSFIPPAPPAAFSQTAESPLITNSEISATPAISLGNRLFVPTAEGQLYNYDANTLQPLPPFGNADGLIDEYASAALDGRGMAFFSHAGHLFGYNVSYVPAVNVPFTPQLLYPYGSQRSSPVVATTESEAGPRFIVIAGGGERLRPIAGGLNVTELNEVVFADVTDPQSVTVQRAPVEGTPIGQPAVIVNSSGQPDVALVWTEELYSPYPGAVFPRCHLYMFDIQTAVQYDEIVVDGSTVLHSSPCLLEAHYAPTDPGTMVAVATTNLVRIFQVFSGGTPQFSGQQTIYPGEIVTTPLAVQQGEFQQDELYITSRNTGVDRLTKYVWDGFVNFTPSGSALLPAGNYTAAPVIDREGRITLHNSQALLVFENWTGPTAPAPRISAAATLGGIPAKLFGMPSIGRDGTLFVSATVADKLNPGQNKTGILVFRN